jgi:hypothetical protein
MSFEDELREVIQNARADRERHDQEGREFEARWQEMLESAVWPLLREAARAFKAENIAADVELIDESVVLKAVLRGERFLCTLTLKADNEKRLVVCSSSLPNSKDESFTLEHLSPAAIQSKVKQFADQIARGNSPMPETSAF